MSTTPSSHSTLPFFTCRKLAFAQQIDAFLLASAHRCLTEAVYTSFQSSWFEDQRLGWLAQMCARSRSPKNALHSPTINKHQLLPVMMLATDRAAVPRPEGRSPMVATIEGFHCTSTMFSFLLVLVVLTQQVSSIYIHKLKTLLSVSL